MYCNACSFLYLRPSVNSLDIIGICSEFINPA
nr:MAG TPA: hypothetical protein [Caudoviricetes sp.]